MKYFRRYQPDGSCAIICLECFQTIGTAHDSEHAAQLELLHSCPGPNAAQSSASLPGADRQAPPRQSWSDRFFQFVARLPGPQSALLFLAILLLVYVLPTALEFAAVHSGSSAIAVILLGDFIGCACLATLLRMPLLGVALYISLLSCELCLHTINAVHRIYLPWILDLVPTLVAAGRIASIRADLRRRRLLR